MVTKPANMITLEAEEVHIGKSRPLSMDSNNSIDHDSLDSQIATLNSLIISDQSDALLDTRSTPFNNMFTDNISFMPPMPNDRHLFRNNSLSAIPTNDYFQFAPFHQQQLLRRESFPNLNATYTAHDGWPNYLQIKQHPQQQSPNAMRKFSADVNRRFFDARSYSNPDLRRCFDDPSHVNPLLVPHFARRMSPPVRRPSSVMEEKYASMSLEEAIRDIYSFSKDQYGCRFFQKKLEEPNTEQRDLIFIQTFPYFTELMTDPFGNYLCQKLMEYCTQVQRTMMIDQVASSIMTISLNMHGTRAVQKMIEISIVPEQVNKIKKALTPHVVTLIKDINGNHVIQKCLNKLSNVDKQFIYDAVSENCTEVATHRHGCCVLQRCIDFSNPEQKKQLVNEIIRHALKLVQDPYGNYVVQYVLELGDAQFSDQLIRQFLGHVANLSVQKYSSNVMEKCIRVAEENTRRDLIDEMVQKPQLDTLLKDNFANYVIQTALDFAEESQHQKMSECIKPLLPNIRNTSYCKRIQGKLNREKLKQNSNIGVHPLATDLSFIPTSPFYF